MRYIDLHCDALLYYYSDDTFDLYDSDQSAVTFKKLIEANAIGQCFAIYQPVREKLEALGVDGQRYLKHMVDCFYRSIREHEDEVAFAFDGADIEKNLKDGKLSALLTLEDGRSVEGKYERLSHYRAYGIRMVTLTWFEKNCFGAPSSADRTIMEEGLTSFGKEAIELMNDLDMIVDVSHLSDGGFWDVVERTRKPFVASHSNCRALVPHYRNVSDEMIRAIAEKGGVVGLNFCKFFLNGESEVVANMRDLMTDILFAETKGYEKQIGSRISDMVSHVSHMYQIGGEEVLALGTDFDGVPDENMEIKDPTQMIRLRDALEKHGFSPRVVDKMMFGNALRVLQT